MLCPHLLDMLDLCGESGLSCFVRGLCRLLLLRRRLFARFRCVFLSVSFNARLLRPFCLRYLTQSLSLFGGCLGPVPELVSCIFECHYFCLCLGCSFSMGLFYMLRFSLCLCGCFCLYFFLLRKFFFRMLFSTLFLRFSLSLPLELCSFFRGCSLCDGCLSLHLASDFLLCVRRQSRLSLRLRFVINIVRLTWLQTCIDCDAPFL